MLVVRGVEQRVAPVLDLGVAGEQQRGVADLEQQDQARVVEHLVHDPQQRQHLVGVGAVDLGYQPLGRAAESSARTASGNSGAESGRDPRRRFSALRPDPRPPPDARIRRRSCGPGRRCRVACLSVGGPRTSIVTPGSRSRDVRGRRRTSRRSAARSPMRHQSLDGSLVLDVGLAEEAEPLGDGLRETRDDSAAAAPSACAPAAKACMFVSVRASAQVASPGCGGRRRVAPASVSRSGSSVHGCTTTSGCRPLDDRARPSARPKPLMWSACRCVATTTSSLPSVSSAMSFGDARSCGCAAARVGQLRGAEVDQHVRTVDRRRHTSGCSSRQSPNPTL